METVKDFFGHEYTRIIKDPTFETRLKNFDPNLKLMFDQTEKNFKILEPYLDGSGWSIVVSLQPGEELDENIFNLLWLRRNEHQEKIRNGKNIWLEDFTYENQCKKMQLQENASQNHRYRLMEYRNQWRKAWRELNNMPAADVTAGYRKVEYKPKSRASGGGLTLCR